MQIQPIENGEIPEILPVRKKLRSEVLFPSVNIP